MGLIHKNPVIYVICGKAQTGKDSVAKIIFDAKENSVILSITKPLKEYARIITNWDGNEATKPRDLLQTLGIDLIKKQIDQKFLIRRIIEDIKVLSYYKDNIIISGIRLKEEIDDLKQEFDKVVVIKVERPNFDNGLTLKQKKHITENDLNNYQEGCVIINNNYENLKNDVLNILKEVPNE